MLLTLLPAFSLLTLTATAIPAPQSSSTASPTNTTSNALSSSPRTLNNTLNARPGSLVCEESGARAKGPKKIDCVNALLGLQGQSIEPLEISRHTPQIAESGSCMVSATIAADSQVGEDYTSLLVIYVAGLSVITACDRPGGTGGKVEPGSLRIGDNGDVLVEVKRVEKLGGAADDGDGSAGGNSTLTEVT